MPREPFGTAHGEDSLDVVPPLGVAVERLCGVVADAADAVAVDFDAERAGDPFGQLLRLIVAALPLSRRMKRHRNEHLRISSLDLLSHIEKRRVSIKSGVFLPFMILEPHQGSLKFPVVTVRRKTAVEAVPRSAAVPAELFLTAHGFPAFFAPRAQNRMDLFHTIPA